LRDRVRRHHGRVRTSELEGQVTIPRAVREALALEEGDQLVFRVEGSRAVVARSPDLLALAGSVSVPAGKRGTPWREVLGQTRRARVRSTVTAFVDTNVLVRHLTGDPPAQARRATRYLERADELLLADLIAAEVVYVLESYYEVPRGQVAETLRAVLAFPAVRVIDPGLLHRALEVYEVHRLDFADAYLVASADRGRGRGLLRSRPRPCRHGPPR
jgi:AbrB family looped-hinge helix DNA binding protein